VSRPKSVSRVSIATHGPASGPARAHARSRPPTGDGRGLEQQEKPAVNLKSRSSLSPPAPSGHPPLQAPAGGWQSWRSSPAPGSRSRQFSPLAEVWQSRPSACLLSGTSRHGNKMVRVASPPLLAPLCHPCKRQPRLILWAMNRPEQTSSCYKRMA